MLEYDEFYTLRELVELSGFTSLQIETQMLLIISRDEYKLLVDKTNAKKKYGLKMANHLELKRDFVTELFTGQVMKSIELSKLIIRCVGE